MKPQSKACVACVSGDCLEHGGRLLTKDGSVPVLLILRHGQTAFDAAGTSQGWNMEGLNAEGRAEIQEAIEFLKPYGVTHVFASDIGRAAESADLVSHGLNVPMTLDQHLRPWDLGNLTGNGNKENSPWFRFFIDNPSATIPKGESLDSFESRFEPAFEAYLEDAEMNGMSLLILHSANIIVANNMCDATVDEPEVSLDKVYPGGVLAVWLDGDGYNMEAIFRQKTEE